MRVLFCAAALSAAFACLDFWFQLPAPAGYGPQFIWTDTGVYRRAQGLFYEASTLGNFCAFFLVGLWKLPGARMARLGAAVFFGAALILSYSRASILNLAIATAALLVLQASRRRVVSAFITVAVAIGAATFIAPAFVGLAWQRFSGSIIYFFTSPESVLSGRLASWRALTGFLASHPWHAIFGVGYKTLPYSDFTGAPIVADNMYLSMLVETGLIGLAALVYLNASILRAAWRARASFFGAWIFCFWCGQIFQMLSGDLLTYWRVLPLYFWVLAMAVRSSHEHPVS
jgi:O-antigen ligase